jgi:hypothetical protein
MLSLKRPPSSVGCSMTQALKLSNVDVTHLTAANLIPGSVTVLGAISRQKK